MATFNPADLITDVKITPLRATENSKTVAFASATLGGHFALKDMKVVEGSQGLFVSAPQRKGKDQQGEDRYYDYYHAITTEGREALQKAVLDAYNATVGGGSSNSGNRGASNSNTGTRSNAGAARETRSASSSRDSGRTSTNSANRGGRDYNNDDVPF